MEQGFVFDHNRCVACGACKAACILENRWSFSPRILYTINKQLIPGLPVLHLSLACNHCRNAVCMDGCPADAYHRDPVDGAIEIDDAKCIGCRYCSWNCPWDAPKYIASEKIMGKCNLCHQRLADGLTPACSSACPTGALQYSTINGGRGAHIFPQFADKKLEPSLRLTGDEAKAVEIVPSVIYNQVQDDEKPVNDRMKGNRSLIAFTFLSTCSVAYLASRLLGGHFPGLIPSMSLLILSAILSLFHLGKKNRSWRALSNIRKSPLSREILLFILYSAAALPSSFLQLPWLLILSTVTGFLFLLAIDSVYLYSDRRYPVMLHSGQTFVSALLIVSFLNGRIIPFAFIAILKITASVFWILKEKDEMTDFGIRFLRLALLIIAGVSMISGISYPGYPVFILLMSGELLDRILFYHDFNPLNINTIVTGFFNDKR